MKLEDGFVDGSMTHQRGPHKFVKDDILIVTLYEDVMKSKMVIFHVKIYISLGPKVHFPI